MLTARHLWRLASAILRVAASAVMLPALAHAHAAHDRHAHGPAVQQAEPAAAAHHVSDTVLPGRAVVPAMQGTDACDPADCPCCPGCCAHVFVAADHAAIRGDRLNGRRVAPRSDTAPPLTPSEAAPEPPRPSA